jgi:hypothetical protein
MPSTMAASKTMLLVTTHWLVLMLVLLSLHRR